MSKRPMDMEAIRQARDNLDRIARENPHMIDHARAKWTEKDIATMIADQTKPTYNLDEVAELLGVHKETVRREIHRGALKAGRVGRVLVVSRLDLEAYYQAKGGGRLFADDAPDVPEA